jgi:hypothetical protein
VGRPKVSGVRTVRGSKATVKVKVPAGGAVRVSGPGLQPASKTAKKAGSVAVVVRLSARAQRTLKRRHVVKVKATVRFTPTQGKVQSVGISMTFKTATATKKGRS